VGLSCATRDTRVGIGDGTDADDGLEYNSDTKEMGDGAVVVTTGIGFGLTGVGLACLLVVRGDSFAGCIALLLCHALIEEEPFPATRFSRDMAAWLLQIKWKQTHKIRE
jgi:hypothetical protein